MRRNPPSVLLFRWLSAGALLLASGCSSPKADQPSQSGEWKTPILPGSYSLVGDKAISTVWDCRAVTLKSNPVLTSSQMAEVFKESHGVGNTVAIPKDVKVTRSQVSAVWRLSPPSYVPGSPQATTGIGIWAAGSDPKSNNTIFGSAVSRIYPLSFERTIQEIIREFGAPVRILQTTGHCHLRDTVMIYTASPLDADGRSLEVGQMCRNRPTCSLEQSDPCADPSRRPAKRYMFISLKNLSPGEIGYLNHHSENPFPERDQLTKAVINWFDPAAAAPAGYPPSSPPSRDVCKPAGNPFSS